MMIAPNAEVDDGLIEYVRWGPIGRLGLIRNLPTLYDGTHINHPLAERRQTKRVDFQLDAPVDVMVDGEVLTLCCQSRRAAFGSERRGIKRLDVKRKQEARGAGAAKVVIRRKIVTAVLIVAAFAAVSYLGLRKRGSRFDTFAKCVASKQARMYGAYWCPHCLEQKEMFESSFQYVPYVECGVPGSRDEAPVCKEAGIKHFPTWQFAGWRTP